MNPIDIVSLELCNVKMKLLEIELNKIKELSKNGGFVSVNRVKNLYIQVVNIQVEANEIIGKIFPKKQKLLTYSS